MELLRPFQHLECGSDPNRTDRTESCDDGVWPGCREGRTSSCDIADWPGRLFRQAGSAITGYRLRVPEDPSDGSLNRSCVASCDRWPVGHGLIWSKVRSLLRVQHCRLLMSGSQPRAPCADLTASVQDQGRGHLTPRKSLDIGGVQELRSYLERETGIEPATLCLEGRAVGIVAPARSRRQLPPQNRPFWASDSGRAEHLIEACLEPCRSVKPSD